MTIRSYFYDAGFQNGVRFDEQQINAMSNAFQKATEVLGVKENAPPIVHKVIARIAEAAKDGHCDPQELCKRALNALQGIGNPHVRRHQTVPERRAF